MSLITPYLNGLTLDKLKNLDVYSKEVNDIF